MKYIPTSLCNKTFSVLVSWIKEMRSIQKFGVMEREYIAGGPVPLVMSLKSVKLGLLLCRV